MAAKRKLKVADEVWLATALLHSEQPEREAFEAREIVRRAGQIHPGTPCRGGIQPNVYKHCVANTEPSPSRHRMLYRLPGRRFRLFREGDDYHPGRTGGPTVPQPSALPEERRYLLDWYYAEYNRLKTMDEQHDPLMELVGLGKEVWESLGGGDAFLQWLRADTETIPLSAGAPASSFRPAAPRTQQQTEPRNGSTGADTFQQVWRRLVAHQGEVFATKKGLPFTYRIAGNHGVWITREGRPVNRQLPRGHFEKAWTRRPLKSPRQLQDLQGPSYLFAVLSDPRVAR
jgi:hypothetical protein